MRLTRNLFLLSAAALVTLALASGASATINYGDFVGTNVTFNAVSETSTFGDPEPLFGAPLVSGDQLLFFPANFSATAAGAGDFDLTGAQLQTRITSHDALTTIDTLSINEAGDTMLAGTGTADTYTFIGIAGQITVLSTTSGPTVPVIIPFVGTISPGDTFTLPTDAGTTTWSGGFTVDIAAIVPNATDVMLSFDNNMFAYSEDGTVATIQKKVVGGPVIAVEVIPEPATLSMVALGLFGLALVGRRYS